MPVFSQPPIPRMTAPVNQQILTVSTAYTLKAYAPEDTAVSFWADGVKLGDATLVGSNWEYVWTPSVVDYDITLKAVGNKSGDSVSYTIVVAEANAISQDITTWTKSLGTGGTVTSGIRDPFNGTGAYSVNAAATTGTTFRNISKIMTTAMTEFNHGFEVWIALKSPSDITTVGISSFGGAYANLVTGEKFSVNGGGAYISVVETRIDQDGKKWFRIWTRREAKTSVSSAWTINMHNSILAGPNVTNAANDGFYIYAPRTVDGLLPFTQIQKATLHLATISGTWETWRIQHPYSTNIGIMNSGYRLVQVIKPNGWTSTGNHKCVVVLPPRTDSQEIIAGGKTPHQIIIDADYANTYNAVFIVPTDDIAFFGCKENGEMNAHALVGEIIAEFRKTIWGCSPRRNDTFVLGYSKTAVTSISLMLNYPTVFGKAGSWDGVYFLYRDWHLEPPIPSNQTSGEIIAQATFTTQANFALYDALTLLPSKLDVVNDRKRIVLAGYNQWEYYLVPFKNELDALGIEYDYEYAFRATHSFNSGWMGNMLSKLFAEI